MIIKIVLLCSLLGMLTGRTFAQSSDNIDYVKKVEKYRRMKITGTTLTIMGSVLCAVGTVVMIHDTVDEGEPSDAGVATLVAGHVAFATGIPLWIVGSNNQKKYSKLAQQVNVRINATPRSHGLTLTYRF
ncbi:MAG TPA: hypothetical protein VIU13_14195 [Chryseolinea sp.]